MLLSLVRGRLEKPFSVIRTNKAYMQWHLGASGITGWAITNQILNGYPSPDAFASVTALTNRPLSVEASQWPQSPKLQIVSGIDILNPKGQEALNAELREKVKNVEKISHVYFFGKGTPPFLRMRYGRS